MSQESRVNLEVNLNTLAENFMEIRRRVAPCRLMAVLKANAVVLKAFLSKKAPNRRHLRYFLLQIRNIKNLLLFDKFLLTFGM